jgi:hypothetical protein
MGLIGPSQLWPHDDSGPGGALCSFPVSGDQARGLFRYDLYYVGGGLFGFSTWCSSSSPTCQYPLLLEAVPEGGDFVWLTVFQYHLEAT